MKTFLKSIGACSEAREWVGERTPQQAWEECQRGDWMLWLLGQMAGKPGWPTRKQVVLIACDIAETVLFHVPKGENRPRIAIETARKWARGEATLAEVRAAGYDSYAYDTASARSAAELAAYAAAAYAAAAAVVVYASSAADLAYSTVSAAAAADRESGLLRYARMVRAAWPVIVVENYEVLK